MSRTKRTIPHWAKQSEIEIRNIKDGYAEVHPLYPNDSLSDFEKKALRGSDKHRGYNSICGSAIEGKLNNFDDVSRGYGKCHANRDIRRHGKQLIKYELKEV